jgi:hypothetical protein
MVGKISQATAIEEAGHSVIARKFGLGVQRVNARRKHHPQALTQSAFYLARDSDVATQIRALEQDAIVALAGNAAIQRALPYTQMLDHFDLFDDEVEDAVNVKSCIYRIVCLAEGRPIPTGEAGTLVEMDAKSMEEVFVRLVPKVVALVDNIGRRSVAWPSISNGTERMPRAAGRVR